MKQYNCLTNSLTVVALMLLLSGCFNERPISPQDAPKVALQKVLDSLHAGKYDTYINAIYDDTGHGILPKPIATKLLRQHVEAMRAGKGEPLSCSVHDAVFHTDTLATVYYVITFADSTVETNSQKMVRVGQDWKIVIRN